MLKQGITLWSLALMLGGNAASAGEAPDPVHPQCNGHVRAFIDDTTYVEKGFNLKRQKGWYHRWWSGSCAKVPYPDRWTCTTSKGAAREGAEDQDKSWFAMVERFTTGAGAAKADVGKAMCQLGQFIGLEWARDNDIRCIHTSDLKALWVHLEDSAEGSRLQRISAVRTRATSIIENCRKTRRQRREARRRK